MCKCYVLSLVPIDIGASKDRLMDSTADGFRIVVKAPLAVANVHPAKDMPILMGPRVCKRKKGKSRREG